MRKNGAQKTFKAACAREEIQISWGNRNEGSIPSSGSTFLLVYPSYVLTNQALFIQVFPMTNFTIFRNV